MNNDRQQQDFAFASECWSHSGRMPNFTAMILVTGGTGLVGSHLLLELVQGTDSIRAIKRSSSSLKAIEWLFEAKGMLHLFEQIQWVDGDITDIFSLEDAMQGVSHVYHCAALVSFESKDTPILMKINAEGTSNVVNAALEASIEKLCYVSSTAAVGKGEDGELLNENTKWKSSFANSGYAISKYIAEREVWRGIEEGLNAVMVNPCLVIGSGEWGKSSTKMFASAWKGMAFYTLGSNAFVDAGDVAYSMVQLMKSAIHSERFLVVSENKSYKEFFQMVTRLLGKQVPAKKAHRWMTELAWRLDALLGYLGKTPFITKAMARSSQQNSRYSNAKIIEAIGFEFKPVEESVKETCELFLQQINQEPTPS